MGLKQAPGAVLTAIYVLATVLVVSVMVTFSTLGGCVQEVFSQEQIGVRPVPIPTPDEDRPERMPGLDPIDQMRQRDRIKILNLERRVASMERLARVQVRQIDQLQRYTFGIGRPGSAPPIGAAGPEQSDTPEPIKTPEGLLPEVESDE